MSEYLTLRPAPPSTLPTSQPLTGRVSPGMPSWAMPFGVHDPARLSEKMSFSISGLLNDGQVGEAGFGPALVPVDIQPGTWFAYLLWSTDISPALFVPLEMPAGAGAPLLVVAVAVVRLPLKVLFRMFTTGASFIEMAPPSWAEMLLVNMLLVIVIGDSPDVPLGAGVARPLPVVPMIRIPPPSSWAMLMPT